MQEETGALPSFLIELYQSLITKLDTHQRKEVANLLKKMQSAFASSSEDLERKSLVEHEIDTGNARPIKQQPRRTPIAFRGEEENEISLC